VKKLIFDGFIDDFGVAIDLLKHSYFQLVPENTCSVYSLLLLCNFWRYCRQKKPTFSWMMTILYLAMHVPLGTFVTWTQFYHASRRNNWFVASLCQL